MPQVTVYIREEDIELWRGVIKKSEFIHNALQDRSTYNGAKIMLREDLPPVDEYEEDTLLPLEIDPTNKKRAWDPNIEEWVKV